MDESVKYSIYKDVVMPDEDEECVYLLHFDPPFQHARHYIGYTKIGIRNRMERHLCGGTARGSKLVYHVVNAGHHITLAAIWPGEGRTFERQLKNRGGAARICPICKDIASGGESPPPNCQIIEEEHEAARNRVP